MTTSDPELLRRFATERSEPAFAELVRRHLDLVHSAALRQVDGDAATAADVAQAVFTDLARKAARLTGHTSLTGWLYTSTRFLARNVQRDEYRRRQREHDAHTMKQLLESDGPEPDWQQLRPVLDEAMHELGAVDREAVLLRFFERRPLVEVGAQLGLSENAARMRLDRALEKLRKLLRQRGLHSTTAALALALTNQAVTAAPAGLAVRVSQGAFSVPAAGGGLVFDLHSYMKTAQTKLVLGLATVALLLTPIILSKAARGRDRVSITAADDRAAVAVVAAPAGAGVLVAESAANDATLATATTTAVNQLRLTVLAADSGQPLSGVRVERGWVTDATFRSLRDGTVAVTYPETAKQLRLTTRFEGYADTCLKWSLERGEVVPETYIVRLERAVPIGGIVVDADGKPVTGAKVGFNHEEDSVMSLPTETHDFGWIEVATDSQGHWQISRIAEDMLRRCYGSARHSNQVGSELAYVRRDTEVERLFRAGTHLFHLGRAATVRGMVVEREGNPVSQAKVTVGMVGESGRRESTTGTDGTFELLGCPLGKQLLTAQAKGYAAVTAEVELTPDSKPFRLELRPGNLLRLRVVDHSGQPVPNAYVWLNTMNNGSPEPSGKKAILVQAEVELRSDSEGRVVWDEAPDTELTFGIAAKGHMRVDGYQVQPDGAEHTVTLPSAVTVFGTVRDATSGEAIPRFRVLAGWPPLDHGTGRTNPSWSSLERFTLSFGGGEYRHSFEEALISGIKNPGYILKFEAPGYAPFTSRAIAADEGELRLDVTLRGATARTVTVLGPGGRPAVGAEVALVGVGGKARLVNAGFYPINSEGSIRLITDREGHFELPADDSLVRVIAVHREGIAEADPQEFKSAQSTMTLRAWGRIEGRWMAGDKPAVGREVVLAPVDGEAAPLQFEFTRFKATTDASGRFVLDYVPPGRFKLTQLIRSEQGGGVFSWGHGRAKEVEVLSGEVTQVTFGASGHQVTLRLAWPGGLASPQRWQVHGVVQTPMPATPRELRGNLEALQRWWQAPERQALAKAMKHFPMVSQPDATLSAEDVEPGKYTLNLGAMLLDADGELSSQMTAETVPVAVPEEPATGIVDLGVVPLQLVPVTPPAAASK